MYNKASKRFFNLSTNFRDDNSQCKYYCFACLNDIPEKKKIIKKPLQKIAGKL